MSHALVRPTSESDPVDPVEQSTDEGEQIEDELMIEEVSIDGMCGVY